MTINLHFQSQCFSRFHDRRLCRISFITANLSQSLLWLIKSDSDVMFGECYFFSKATINKVRRCQLQTGLCTFVVFYTNTEYSKATRKVPYCKIKNVFVEVSVKIMKNNPVLHNSAFEIRNQRKNSTQTLKDFKSVNRFGSAPESSFKMFKSYRDILLYPLYFILYSVF